jgi:hypothetical protein
MRLYGSHQDVTLIVQLGSQGPLPSIELGHPPSSSIKEAYSNLNANPQALSRTQNIF